MAGTGSTPALSPLRFGARRSVRAPGLRAAVGALGVAGILVGVTFLVLVATARPSFLVPPAHAGFPQWMAGPLHGVLSGFDPGRQALKWVFSLTLGGLYVAYVLALAGVGSLRARWLAGVIVAVHAVLLLSPPLSLTDVFNYIHYGRMGVVHHLNPYVDVPFSSPHTDPAYPYSNWHHLLSPYGPLFTLITYALVPLGVQASFWALKLLLAIASLGTLAIVWRCAQVLGQDPRLPVAIVGLNPLVLIWGLGGDHLDALMVLALTGALLAMLARRELVGGILLATSLALKASAVVAIPVLLVGSQRKVRALAGFAGAGMVLAAASYAAFGAHIPDVAGQSKFVASMSIPNLLGLALGQGGETDTLRTILGGVLAAVVVGASIQAWRGREMTTTAGVAVLASLLALGWVLPWYLLLLLPFAALSRSRLLRGAALVMGVWLMLSWIPLRPQILHALGLHPSATPLGRQQLHMRQQLLR
jgi:hypothetical protein